MKSLLTVVGLILLMGCTDNRRARTFGGTETINLPSGTKLINATWKDHDLWYVTTARPTNEPPRVSVFQEKSAYGLLEGQIIFKEQ